MTNNRPQLCLGTVQFGLSYGITNKRGKVPEAEVRRMLKLASQSGIELLDTAQAYGSAESVLGRCWPTNASRRLISKLPAKANPESWEKNMSKSLKRLKSPKLDTFLLHRASDLLGSNGKALLNWLEDLRARGLVKRIGISIYSASELEGIPLDRLQVVQLPVSIYDQRLIKDGTLTKLQDLDIAIHLRSVLLQGLLVQPAERWPKKFSIGFREHHSRWLKYLEENNISPLEGALAFAYGCGHIEAILVGATSRKELQQLLTSWEKVTQSNRSFEAKEWAWGSKFEIDPRMW